MLATSQKMNLGDGPRPKTNYEQLFKKVVRSYYYCSATMYLRLVCVLKDGNDVALSSLPMMMNEKMTLPS